MLRIQEISVTVHGQHIIANVHGNIQNIATSQVWHHVHVVF